MMVQLLELMEALVHQRKTLVLILANQTQKFCLTLHYNADNSYLFVNEKEIFKFKANNKKPTFPTESFSEKHP